MSPRLNMILGLVALVLGAVAMSVFTVDQRQYALVFQLGEVKRVITEPGLHFKLPLVQNIRFFDNRILTLESADPAQRAPVATARTSNVTLLTSIRKCRREYSWLTFLIRE